MECREESGVVYYFHLIVIALLRREGALGQRMMRMRIWRVGCAELEGRNITLRGNKWSI